jgi:uncharacterized protein YegL
MKSVPQNSNLENFTLPTGNFGFSATKITGDLGASQYTLASIIVDASGSVSSFKSDLEKAIQETVKACLHSPRADNLMLRLVTFADNLSEVHGFKLLSECNIGDYDNSVNPGGSTALFDATTNAIESSIAYGTNLHNSDYETNAIVIVITDGCDNVSRQTANSVKLALEKAVKSECLESIVSILVGVNIVDSSVKNALDQFQKDAGFTSFIPLADASKSTLAKLAKFVSHSISSQSKSLGSGQAAPIQSLVI